DLRRPGGDVRAVRRDAAGAADRIRRGAGRPDRGGRAARHGVGRGPARPRRDRRRVRDPPLPGHDLMTALPPPSGPPPPVLPPRAPAPATTPGAPLPAPAPAGAVSLRGVSKWYGDVVAVNDVSFEFRPGVTGLLGPNGA